MCCGAPCVSSSHGCTPQWAAYHSTKNLPHRSPACRPHLKPQPSPPSPTHLHIRGDSGQLRRRVHHVCLGGPAVGLPALQLLQAGIVLGAQQQQPQQEP